MVSGQSRCFGHIGRGIAICCEINCNPKHVIAGGEFVDANRDILGTSPELAPELIDERGGVLLVGFGESLTRSQRHDPRDRRQPPVPQ